MKHRNLFIVAAAFAFGATACTDDANEPSLVADTDITADVAQASGEAIAEDVGQLITAELLAGLPWASPPDHPMGPGGGTPLGITVTRTRTCFDANNQPQTQCDPSTTASIQVTLTMDGSFTRQGTRPGSPDTVTMTASIHRNRSLTISGLLGTETSRTHNGNGSSNDTTTFTDSRHSRTMVESSVDSTKNVVFNLPRVTNPWPVSGQMVRVVNGTVTITTADRTETRTFSRYVVVTFPADAQGNVTIQINDRTCTLNLVTRRVVCSTT